MTDISPSGPVVAVAELRAAFDLVMSAVERQYGARLDLRAGHYWEVSLSDAFEFSGEPSEPTVGDLVDDAASLDELLGRDSDDVFVWHDLSHLVGLLRRVAALDLP